MVSGLTSMNAYSYTGVVTTRSMAGKLCVPVQPSMVMYTQFEHISGIAADKGQSGISIDKIQILNRLIDQLVNMKQKPSISSEENKLTLSEDQVDALIKNYQEKIQTTISTAQGNPYALGGAAIPSAGIAFDIAA